MNPLKVENGQAVFTSGQISIYGLPENNGWLSKYIVIEEEADSHPLTVTYQSGAYHIPTKDIHRYCRISRFKIVLTQLMGDFGFSTQKSRDILCEVEYELPGNISYLPPCLMWNSIWTLLKTNKISNYYNRIPAILRRLKLAKPLNNNKNVFQNVMDDFKMLHEVFVQTKTLMKRKYFPSLRFIALKLLARHGYKLPINIPYARTPSKIKRLEEDYETLWNKVGEIEEELLEKFFNF